MSPSAALPPCSSHPPVVAARPRKPPGRRTRAPACHALLVLSVALVTSSARAAPGPNVRDAANACVPALAVTTLPEPSPTLTVVVPGPNLKRIEALTHPQSLDAFEAAVRARPSKRIGPQAGELLRREIAAVRRLLDLTPPDSPERPAIVRRLFTRYAELAHAAAYDEHDRSQRARWFRALEAPRLAAALEQQATADRTLLQIARRGVIRTGEALVAETTGARAPQLGNGPPTLDGSEVLLELGLQYELSGDGASARRAYRRLLESSPRTQAASEARLALAELDAAAAALDARRWPEAEVAYRTLLTTTPRGTRLHDYLQYKLGHALWQQGSLEDALAELGALAAERARRRADAPDALIEAAQQDALLLYVLAGDPTTAPTTLSSWASTAQEEARLLAELGALYRETAATDRAFALHRSMAEHAPARVACQQWAAALEAALAGLDEHGGVTQALRELLEAERRMAEAAVGDDEQRACTERTAALGIEVAIRWSNEALVPEGSDGDAPLEVDEVTEAPRRWRHRERDTSASVDSSEPVVPSLAAADELLSLLLARFGPTVLARTSYPRLARSSWPTVASLRERQAALASARGDWRRCGSLYSQLRLSETTPPSRAVASFGAAWCYANALSTSSKPADESTRVAARAAFDEYGCLVRPPQAGAVGRERHAEIALADARLRVDDGLDGSSLEALRAVAIDLGDTAAGELAAELFARRWRERWTGQAAPNSAARSRMRADTRLLRAGQCPAHEATRRDRAVPTDTADPSSSGLGAVSDACGEIHRVELQLDHWDADDLYDACLQQAPAARAACTRAAARYGSLWHNHYAPLCRARDPQCADAAPLLARAGVAAQHADGAELTLALLRELVDPANGLAHTPEARAASIDIARAYHLLDERASAGDWYERFARDNPSQRSAAAALVEATLLRLGQGAVLEADRTRRTYETRYRGREPVLDARLNLAYGRWLAEHEGWGAADGPLRRAATIGEMIDRPDFVVQAQALLARAARRADRPARAAEASTAGCAAWARTADRLGEVLERDIDPLDGAGHRRHTFSAAAECLLACAELARETDVPAPLPAFEGTAGADALERFVATELEPWLRARRARIERLTAAYTMVSKVDVAEPDAALVSASRAAVARLWTDLGDELRGAEHPAAWNQLGLVPGSSPPLLWAELRASYRELLRAHGLELGPQIRSACRELAASRRATVGTTYAEPSAAAAVTGCAVDTLGPAPTP